MTYVTDVGCTIRCCVGNSLRQLYDETRNNPDPFGGSVRTSYAIPPGCNREEIAMFIKRHDESDVVELSDGSIWRIWPKDLPNTMQWLPTTEMDVARTAHEMCSHALINRSDGSRVRVIAANRKWPFKKIRRLLAGNPVRRCS